jgi:predicted nuclease of predicted toxin-antitoxin system
MTVGLYLDVHVPRAIADQLRRRGVDVVTAIEDGCDQLSDEDLLDRASFLGRVLFTQDIRFKALAEDWQRRGRPFSGLVFGHQRAATIGRYVCDLELVA